jgi:protein-glutamine gamma-glutamyltransferase
LNRELLQFGSGAAGSGFRLGAASQWVTALLQSWDALNAWWQDEVVGFNFARQLNLADWLGFGDRDWQTLAIALGTGMAAWLLWIAWSLRRLARAPRPDALARAWRRIDRRLRRAGHPRASQEGVLDYCERLARIDPIAAAELAPLARRYALLRYGPPAPEPELREFQRAAGRFRFPRPQGQ